MKSKRKPSRRRNPVAKALRSPALRRRVVRDKRRDRPRALDARVYLELAYG